MTHTTAFQFAGDYNGYYLTEDCKVYSQKSGKFLTSTNKGYKYRLYNGKGGYTNIDATYCGKMVDWTKQYVIEDGKRLFKGEN